MEPLILLVLLVAAVIGAGVLLAGLGLLQYRLGALVRPETRVVIALTVVGVGALLSVTLMSRSLDEGERAAANFVAYEDYASGFAASRWLSLLLVGPALLEATRGWLAARRAPADPAAPLLWSLIAFHVGTLLIQCIAVEHPGVSHKDLYLPIILIAVYYQRTERPDLVIEAARRTLFALTAGSLCGIVLAPDFVLHRPEPGLLPGIDWRLYGLAGHANTLGPVALVALLLELYRPSAGRWWRGLRMASSAAVLVLAQSKTAWGAAVAIAALIGVPLLLAPRHGPQGRVRSFRRAVWTLVGCIVLAAALAIVLSMSGIDEVLRRKLELTTLNGRLQIWDITLAAWRENLLFGYGSSIWGVDRQFQFSMFHVGHAHNQVVQTLGEAGLAGLVLLALFVAALARAAMCRFVETRGLVGALLIVLLARCITEAPMRGEGLISWSTFVHVLTLALACHAMRSASPARATRLATDSPVAETFTANLPSRAPR